MLGDYMELFKVRIKKRKEYCTGTLKFMFKTGCDVDMQSPLLSLCTCSNLFTLYDLCAFGSLIVSCALYLKHALL